MSFLMSHFLALPVPGGSPYFLPASLFTIFTGLFIIIARKKAVTQVMGYMSMENGIYAFGVSLAIHEPFGRILKQRHAQTTGYCLGYWLRKRCRGCTSCPATPMPIRIFLN